jgi:hypothetical protein
MRWSETLGHQMLDADGKPAAPVPKDDEPESN